jgi:DNA-binding MarR family transcriptional regulator
MTQDPIDDSFQRWTELGWPGAHEMAAFMSVLRVHKLLVDRVREVLATSHLSITEHASLVYLAMSDDERQPLGKIAKRVMIGPGRCNYMINKLEANGFVRREPHPYDGRTTLAVLTDTGREVANEGVVRVAEIRHGFGAATAEQLDALRQLADVLLQAELLSRRRRRRTPPVDVPATDVPTTDVPSTEPSDPAPRRRPARRGGVARGGGAAPPSKQAAARRAAPARTAAEPVPVPVAKRRPTRTRRSPDEPS